MRYSKQERERRVEIVYPRSIASQAARAHVPHRDCDSFPPSLYSHFVFTATSIRLLTMVRGPGKFKTKRGGGRSFSRNLQLDENGTAVAVPKDRGWDAEDDDEDDEDDDEEEEDEDEEDEEEEEEESVPPPKQAGSSTAAPAPKNRAERKAAAIARNQANKGDEDVDELLESNPNRGGVKHLSLADVAAPREMSRREK